MLALPGGFGSLRRCQPADCTAHPSHPLADPAACLDWRIFQSSALADAAGTSLKSEFGGGAVGFRAQSTVGRERNDHDIGALLLQFAQQALGQAVFNDDVGDFQQLGDCRIVCCPRQRPLACVQILKERAVLRLSGDTCFASLGRLASIARLSLDAGHIRHAPASQSTSLLWLRLNHIRPGVCQHLPRILPGYPLGEFCCQKVLENFSHYGSGNSLRAGKQSDEAKGGRGEAGSSR